MKIAEIKEMTTNDLVERIEAEVANYHQMLLNSLCVLNLRLMQEFVIEKRFFIM